MMTYGSETWPIRAQEMRKMEKIEKIMIKLMCRVILKHRCKSEELRKRLEIEDIADVDRKCRLEWFDHLERKDAKD